MSKHRSSAFEDLWIERECYKELVLDNAFATRQQLQALVKEAKADPKIRSKAKRAIASASIAQRVT